MKVKDYLDRLDKDKSITFVKTRAREDANTPYYHAEYQTTPVVTADEWLKLNNEKLLTSIVLNDKQMPIEWLSGTGWGNWVKNGLLKCLLIVSQEDFERLYPSAKLRNSIESCIDNQLDI